MSAALLTYVFNALWQVPLLAASAWFITRLLRSLGPRTQHRVWVSALLLQAVLPACSVPAAWARLACGWLLRLIPWAAAPSTGGVRVTIAAGAAVGSHSWTIALLRGGLAAYGLVTAWLLLRLLWRLYRLHVLRRTAQRVTLTKPFAEAWASCAAKADLHQVEIAESAGLRSPVTLGCRRLLLLLPPGIAGTLAKPELLAMLAHETAHLQRNDFTKNLLYEFIVLPVAFHPGLWWTQARMAESREMICDSMACAQAGGNQRFAGLRYPTPSDCSMPKCWNGGSPC